MVADRLPGYQPARPSCPRSLFLHSGQTDAAAFTVVTPQPNHRDSHACCCLPAVLQTNDDAITEVTQPVILNVTERHQNHNGCPMPATWFVSINFTDPTLVQEVRAASSGACCYMPCGPRCRVCVFSSAACGYQSAHPKMWEQGPGSVGLNS